MTTIAYRSGIMAADSSCWLGDTLTHDTTKIYRVHGALIGCCGNLSDVLAFIDWARESGHADEYPRMTEMYAIAVDPSGRIRNFEFSSPSPMRVRSKYCAAGTGAEFALGAMFAGADAVTAVRAACRHDSKSKGRVRSYRLNP